MADGVDTEDMVIMRLAVEEAMASLTEAEKEAFLLCEQEGLSSEEAGEKMGKSGNAVRCLKLRAAKKLGEYLRQFLA